MSPSADRRAVHPVAPRPVDDAARLAVLCSYQIMDTAPEQAYDDLVLLAAMICGTRQAAISFVDEDRQWFKASLGIDVPQSPRDDSFCAYTILDAGHVLQVPDARQDPRFAGNPFVTECDLRFYAGTALVGSDDQPVGALCVIADTPRRLRPDQVAALEALGRQVVAQLELRRQLIAARADAARAMDDECTARRRRDVVVRAGADGEDLRRALDEGELVVHYQPFFDVCRTGRELRAHVSGAEALVRWRHPGRGLLGADRVVPLAEQTGLVIELGHQVLAQAICQTAQWDRRGALPRDFQTHVNLAAEQLHDGTVLDTVVDLLRTHGLDPHRLCLEVTESGLLHVEEFTVEAAGALRGLGVGLALDDFGTGFSSLTQLRSYPFGVVKIDRSFVQGLGSSAEDEAIVESVITLAHRLGIVAIAEGVETLDQLCRLVRMGCARVQGFLLGHPVSSQTWDTAVLPAEAVWWGA